MKLVIKYNVRLKVNDEFIDVLILIWVGNSTTF